MDGSTEKHDRSKQEEPLTGGGRTKVSRMGNVVFREAGPWSSTVLALLRHLGDVGFPGAPRVVGSGFDQKGRETLTYVDGEFVHPNAWDERALPLIGAMLRDLHNATRSFEVPENAVWRPWHGRSLGGDERIIGHCDLGQWNIVARNGLPVALIDWEVAGPVDRMYELAQACWLNAHLFDDDVAERLNLPPAKDRARYVRLILDGYEMPSPKRVGFVDKIVEFAIQDAANEAIEYGVTRDTRDVNALWGITWRTRSAAWIMRNRSMIERCIG